MENICQSVAQNSSEFEKNNSNLKKSYLLMNILLFNKIIATLHETYNIPVASFGTGYPFYAIDEGFTRKLPIIGEQLRYNEELIKAANEWALESWPCQNCLSQNSHMMPDLKQICKPCPNVPNELKPRKVINRLPDLDMWLVCYKKDIEIAKKGLNELFKYYEFYPSDINPLKSIEDIKAINYSLQHSIMPSNLLPLDSHIIAYETLYNLISLTPYTLNEAMQNKSTPYLPIHPLSLRKVWQYDDTAYNFIHDYLSSLTPFNFDEEMQKQLDETRKLIANNYTFSKLYDILLMTGPDSVKRRHETPELKRVFKGRINSWKR